jgi:dTDP-4-amino-4,6-dideoxy-D-galactose acyltransferase
MSPVTVDAFDGPVRRLESLVVRWPFKPHRWIADGSPDALQRLVFHRLQEKLRRDDVHAWVASGDSGAVHGLAILQPLEWDSAVLDMKSARIDLIAAEAVSERGAVVDALLAALVAEAARERIQHISVRVDAGDDAAIHALEQRGFLNVDALLTFGAAVNDLPRTQPAVEISVRLGSEADARTIGDIAAREFEHGRFHSDPSVAPERARGVYRAWAEGCCRRTAADAVLIAGTAHEMLGFVACRIERDTAVHLQRSTGTIILIASRNTARGRGVGTMLVAAAGEWFRNERAVAVEVGTQLRNVSAARLYERCGFRLVAGALSFRMMIDS